MKDPYAVLGVPRNANDEAIRTSYKRLAKRYHPDVSKAPGAEERFKEISAAYAVLSDAQKRRQYDEFGESGLNPGFNPRAARQWKSGGFPGFSSSPGFDDVLESLFGAGGSRRAARGQDQLAKIVVEPMLAITGGETEVAVQRPSGNTDRLRVRIPAGAKDGGKLRLKGQGLPPRGGGPCGDLVLRLTIPSHPILRRNGDNLEMDVPITILEAMEGGAITVPTPTGTVKVTVPPNARPGSKLRVRGRGIQKRGRPGDLFLVLRTVTPTSSDPVALEAARVLEALYDGDPRGDLEL